MHRLIDGQTKLREELWNDVDRVRNELRMETASRKEDTKSHKDQKQIKTGGQGTNDLLYEREKFTPSDDYQET